MKALVMSGGGVKGAFQSGAVDYLLGDLQIDFHILVGVSVGAINAAFLAQFKNGEEKIAAKEMIALWDSISTKDVYVDWKPFGKIQSTWTGGFYNPAPLKKFIKKNISLKKIRSSGKHVSVGVISLNSGKYKIFDQTSDNFIDFVLGSSLFPGMFPPIKIQNELWMDGGLKQISPIDVAVKLGADEVCAIVTSPDKRLPKVIERPAAMDALKRALDLSTEKIMSNDIEKVKMHNILATNNVPGYNNIKLDIINPKYNLTEDFLDFNPIIIKELLALGYIDAKDSYKC